MTKARATQHVICLLFPLDSRWRADPGGRLEPSVREYVRPIDLRQRHALVLAAHGRAGQLVAAAPVVRLVVPTLRVVAGVRVLAVPALTAAASADGELARLLPCEVVLDVVASADGSSSSRQLAVSRCSRWPRGGHPLCERGSSARSSSAGTTSSAATSGSISRSAFGSQMPRARCGTLTGPLSRSPRGDCRPAASPRPLAVAQPPSPPLATRWSPMPSRQQLNRCASPRQPPLPPQPPHPTSTPAQPCLGQCLDRHRIWRGW